MSEKMGPDIEFRETEDTIAERVISGGREIGVLNINGSRYSYDVGYTAPPTLSGDELEAIVARGQARTGANEQVSEVTHADHHPFDSRGPR